LPSPSAASSAAVSFSSTCGSSNSLALIAGPEIRVLKVKKAASGELSAVSQAKTCQRLAES
jgi:hypothetical protein